MPLRGGRRHGSEETSVSFTLRKAMMLTWNWSGIFQTIVAAGFGTVIAQSFFTLLQEYRHKRKKAAYMAMRIAIILERYAATCLELIRKNHHAKLHCNEFSPQWDSALPALEVYPGDVAGWEALDRKLAGRCLSFRNKVQGSQAIIDSTWDYDVQSVGDTTKEHAAARGLEACELVAQLRRNNKIEKADLMHDYPHYLKKCDEEARKLRSKREQLTRRPGLRSLTSYSCIAG